MMLQALCAYAEREGLGNLDFETRAVDYEMCVAPDGTFLGLVPLGTAGRRAQLAGLPVGPPSKNNPGFPSFVVDNAQYVLGTAKKSGKAGNAEKCFASYQKLICTAANETGDEGLAALACFLARADQIARAEDELSQREAARSARADTSAKNVASRGDRVLVPALGSEGSRYIHDRDHVVAWWKALQDKSRVQAAEGPLGRCLVTGRLAAVALTHPPVKGAPFRGTGAKLVALDKGAFVSHGLEQGDNAPVCEPAARGYTSALNALLERDSATGRRRSAVDLDRESVVVFWTREPSDAPKFVLDVLAPPIGGADAVAAVTAPWRGSVSRSFDPTPFYAVTLGVNSGRVVVRDWLETTAPRVTAALDQWFDELHIGAGGPEPLPLAPLLGALQATPNAQDKRGLPPGLAATLFRAAVLGGPLPRLLLVRAVERMRIPPDKRAKRNDALRLRTAIIKAVLRRQRPNPVEVSVALDESRTDPAYLLGRLFAALEKLQAVASGRGSDLSATIRDRYYGAASTRPATVFPTLLRLSMHHASKTKDGGLGIVAEKAKARIVNELVQFPSTLGLEDQGLFAIGYYHQREAFFTKK